MKFTKYVFNLISMLLSNLVIVLTSNLHSIFIVKLVVCFYRHCERSEVIHNFLLMIARFR